MGRTTDIDSLTPDPQNRRLHPERNQQMMQASIQAVGVGRSIVIDQDGVVLAGNGMVAAAKAAGITRVRVIESSGDELIAVQRTDLTPEARKQLALYDNRTAELAAWDPEGLKADRDLGTDLQPFWTDSEQALMFGTEVQPSWDGMPEFTQKDLAFRTLAVHFASAEDVQAFLQLIGREDITEKTRYLWYPQAPVESVIGSQEWVPAEKEGE